MRLANGDALIKLRKLDENSLDALVTDPPAGIAFMGKDWDKDKGGRDQWIAWLSSVLKEAKRVLKPGAYALVWALPRTSHWTATAIENSGFDIRDIVTHIFGTGFPKSLNVGKAIDKAAGAKRKVIGRRTDRAASPIHNIKGGYNKKSPNNLDLSEITAPSTKEAKQWDGWGTALKPAAEHWILARTPPSEKTVAANVLKWGTGAINIDESRIEPPKGDHKGKGGGGVAEHWQGKDMKNTIYEGGYKRTPPDHTQGRFPANVMFDEEAGRMLDEQSGTGKSGSGTRGKGGNKYANGKGFANTLSETGQPIGYYDFGGASRFFYCPKASSAERNKGLEDLPKKLGGMRSENSGQHISRRKGDDPAPVPNHHPTVKALDLMEYLIRLITPPKGIVLDPFMGSGSTGIAARRAGFDFIGIEKDTEYFEIAKKRLGK